MVVKPCHMVEMPKWATLGLRVAQLVLALMVLVLNAYELSYVAFNVYCYSIAMACLTLIIVIYNLVARLAAPRAYNAWAVLTLDVFMAVVWLVAFALMASLAADPLPDTCYDYYLGYYSCYRRKRDTTVQGYWGTMAVVSVFGAVEFILFLISLAHFSVRLHRHRKAGLPLKPNAHDATAAAAAAPPPPVYTAGGVPLDKIDADQHQQQQSPYQLQTPYYQPAPPLPTQPIQPPRSASATTYATPSPIATSAPATPPPPPHASSGYYQLRMGARPSELQVTSQHPGVSELGTYRGHA